MSTGGPTSKPPTETERPSIDATAPAEPRKTATIGTRAPIISAASSAVPAPVSTSASRSSMNTPGARPARLDERAGGAGGGPGQAAGERGGVVVADGPVRAGARGHHVELA